MFWRALGSTGGKLPFLDFRHLLVCFTEGAQGALVALPGTDTDMQETCNKTREQAVSNNYYKDNWHELQPLWM